MDPIVVLTQALATIPLGHRDRPGMLRAIEVLRVRDEGGAHGLSTAWHRGQTTPTASTCRCDGPSHAYSPGWCPEAGPVAGR